MDPRPPVPALQEAKLPQKHVDKCLLALEDPFARLCDQKPRAPVDFGELDRTAGARRPLDPAKVARQLLRIAIAFKCPGGHQLSAGLLHRAQFEKLRPRRKARLFLEFALGSLQRLLTFRIFAFRNGPSPSSLFVQKGPPG